MSKLDIRISYKDACILKHALRNQCECKENEYTDYERVNYSVTKKEWKELEEEKRTLERFTEQIEECGFKHNRNIFKEV
ncbi:hypothetical protein [Clostridium butyricum]